MTYGKIINGKLTYAPHRIGLGGMQIFNPTPDQLTQAGYKPVTETPMPDDAPDGQHYEAQYTDSGDTITQGWTLVENEEVEGSSGNGGNNSSADPLAGKNILFAGDSLVSGFGWAGGFANCLQEDHPTAIITNVAEAGALLTYAADRPWIQQQLQENIAGKDILIFDGGFNDIIYPGKVMGTVPDDIAFNSNPTTVADAFAAWLWSAREANPTMDIFYIIPCMYRSAQTGGINTSVGNEFVEILKTICGYYSVGVIDLRFNGRVPLYSPLGGTTNPYMYDSLHPNELGYRKLAPFIDHEICKCY